MDAPWLLSPSNVPNGRIAITCPKSSTLLAKLNVDFRYERSAPSVCENDCNKQKRSNFVNFKKMINLPSQNIVETRVQFDLILVQVFVQFFRSQYFRDAHQLKK